ncbi:hypothetical protein [Paenibacillus sp. FSL R7-0337]|uniref:hypothetical protein n=1 Tax=Paenibacillus sp. FSL R7-0337 TaxID=1926588 RepID=UPI00096F65FB|nr:hypothetical protein [Paenibacillus sp. FSL R7-0337]OMF88740.1 hypothetical protein BK147_26405 [Paenibacillus sp. FSL R7-0337]
MNVLFKRNPDIKKNAYPNWRRTDYSSWEFMTYSEMYKTSGDVLLGSVHNTFRYEADAIIIPSIFLYRHSVELILKAIMLTHYLMEQLMTREKIQKKLHGHDLEVLWSRAENIIRLYLYDSIKRDRKPLELMMGAVKELNSLDPSSMMFRYPFDNEYKDAQLIGDKQHNYGIDYEELKSSFGEVYNYFKGCFDTIYNKYENLETTPIL